MQGQSAGPYGQCGLRRGALLQRDHRRAFLYDDVAVIVALAQSVNQIDQRLSRSYVFLRRSGGAHGFDFIDIEIPAQQKLFVRYALGVHFLTQFLNRGLRRLPLRPFLGAGTIEDLCFHRGLHQFGAFASPVTERVLNDLVGYFLIALADDDIDGCLAADELRQRGDHDRVAQLRAHSHGLFKHLLDLLFHAHLAQLMAQIGDHTAGHLVLVLGIVILHGRANGETFALGDNREMVRNWLEQFFVDESLVTKGAEIPGEVEQRRVRRTIGEWRQSRVDDFDAQLDRLQTAQGSEPGSTVRMQLDFDAVGVLKHDRHQRFYPLRREQTSGIFEAETIYFERCRIAGALREVLIGVFGRDGIDDVGNRIDTDVLGNLGLPRPAF